MNDNNLLPVALTIFLALLCQWLTYSKQQYLIAEAEKNAFQAGREAEAEQNRVIIDELGLPIHIGDYQYKCVNKGRWK